MHYRANESLFERVRGILQCKHVVFVGFSHKDPEVSRLVEDAIYQYELARSQGHEDGDRPQLYSLQFDMRTHTPEIFAARGLVALTPAVAGAESGDARDVRTRSLSRALGDLIGASNAGLHDDVFLDDDVREAATRLDGDLQGALGVLSGESDRIAELAASQRTGDPLLAELVDRLGPFASQGVYLVDEAGDLIDYEVPASLDRAARALPNVKTRPYFQQAKSFRRPFVSNAARSIFNGQSTFFSCFPIVSGTRFSGLLFAAAQVGQWSTPIEVAEACWSVGRTFLLIDGNGVCLVPPLRELELAESSSGTSDAPRANRGYPYDRLLALSRRDALVRHVTKSVVPVAQDDDVLRLADDLSQFSVIREIRDARWKVGISVPLIRDSRVK